MNQQPLTIHAIITTPGDRPKPLRVGQHRTMQGKRGRVTSITPTTLGALTRDDARLLGHRTLTAMRIDWLARRDKDWLNAVPRVLDEQLRRFNTRWAHKPCDVVTYVRVAPAPRLLAAAGRGIDDGTGNVDYTHRPARCIDREAGAVVEPDPRYVQQARLSSIATRENFQADLEAYRAQRKAERRPHQQAA
jgi:hypothetical protein